MKYLGYDVSASTVRNVLDAHGIVPDPERRRRGNWLQFIETQQYVAAATDFAHVELATPYGLAACRSEIFGFGKSMSIPIDA